MLYVVAYYQELFQIAAPGVAMRGFWSRLPSLSPKSLSAWPTQVADHLVPNQVLGFFEFFREREGGKSSVFKGLQKPLSAQIQEN
jgi:hypothetical protein